MPDSIPPSSPLFNDFIDPPMGPLRCTKCKELKPPSAFTYDTRNARRGLTGRRLYRSWCKACKNRKAHERHKEQVYDPIRVRDSNLRQNYGITLEEYNRLLAQQNGVCAICQQPETKILRGKITFLSVDHCHTSHRIRALLCQECNTAFGMLRESPERIQALLRYAEKWQGV